jgi:hypothetical protein
MNENETIDPTIRTNEYTEPKIRLNPFWGWYIVFKCNGGKMCWGTWEMESQRTGWGPYYSRDMAKALLPRAQKYVRDEDFRKMCWRYYYRAQTVGALGAGTKLELSECGDGYRLQVDGRCSPCLDAAGIYELLEEQRFTDWLIWSGASPHLAILTRRIMCCETIDNEAEYIESIIKKHEEEIRED